MQDLFEMVLRLTEDQETHHQVTINNHRAPHDNTCSLAANTKVSKPTNKAGEQAQAFSQRRRRTLHCRSTIQESQCTQDSTLNNLLHSSDLGRIIKCSTPQCTTTARLAVNIKYRQCSTSRKCSNHRCSTAHPCSKCVGTVGSKCQTWRSCSRTR